MKHAAASADNVCGAASSSGSAMTKGSKMGVFLVAVMLGLLPAAIARSKGRNFLPWWIFGALLLIVALPAVLLMGPSTETKRPCPHCRTWIDRYACVCPQCTRDVPTDLQSQGSVPSVRAPGPRASYAERRRPWEDGR